MTEQNPAPGTADDTDRNDTEGHFRHRTNDQDGDTQGDAGHWADDQGDDTQGHKRF